MILSRCCKEAVDVIHDYYVCERCRKPCATITSSSYVKDDDNDAGNDVEIETFFD